MAGELKILVATVSGNAEAAAEEMAETIRSTGRRCSILSMGDLDASVFDAGGDFLLCTSTHGVGDVPDEALDFYEDLQQHRPDLDSVRYGVYALGDSVYDTFCQAGKVFDDLLTGLGATRVGTMGTHDASGGELAEDEAVGWVEDWIELLDPR